MLLGIPIEFWLFAATLLGIMFGHGHTLRIAVAGTTAITVYKLLFGSFRGVTGLAGLGAHFGHEWVTLANLLCLLVGFALLSNHFERSRVPEELPRVLPDDWRGGLMLLAIVFVLSAFLDNIAAALIGGSIARTVYRARVHVGYVAAIVAASNAGGSGSVVGDTTTTMMWLAGVDPVAVLPAFIAAGVSLVVCGVVAARQQHRLQPIMKDPPTGVSVEWSRLAIVLIILTVAIGANVVVNTRLGSLSERFPFLGVAVWVALLATAPWRQPDWRLAPVAARGAMFLLSLVFAASLMPVEQLPGASWATAFGLGFVSSVFDNIPLTALAIEQGGYDWGVLAYAVGFGGSMLWFGSSAGVAICSVFGQARSAGAWVRAGWHVALAYVVGFAVMQAAWGWHPTPRRADRPAAAAAAGVSPSAVPAAPRDGMLSPPVAAAVPPSER